MYSAIVQYLLNIRRLLLLLFKFEEAKRQTDNINDDN